jgi:hypothetical protein
MYREAASRRQARERVAPYSRNLTRWQSRAVMLDALAGSGGTAGATIEAARQALRAEIEQARDTFLIEMDDIRNTPSAVDYLGSVDRLLATRY